MTTKIQRLLMAAVLGSWYFFSQAGTMVSEVKPACKQQTGMIAKGKAEQETESYQLPNGLIFNSLVR